MEVERIVKFSFQVTQFSFPIFPQSSLVCKMQLE